ncbi:phytoene desaturase family protein [Streptomyces clavuligerus]|nr:NAD(P)/FAD-dependent oxidoreductase [Streptomyces clavuligerus]ANW16805.1 dehydrogenase [Streptomyces clavuligerus]AXU11335.1 NAD(P)/FAD-dependent oxidoreductase [Streptomyces clavuligerus]MBY6301142.1 NAD(P)/FAD-dependent oxidoreductase [Streptomyces clavuligerus]QCS04203.1 NAD(P)/FAD-dependent oxidoreductase [Streptomyces clavuligerus]QPJ96409.1 FAD-dependent oxidoreductase [Streptomyces clavuligerus]
MKDTDAVVVGSGINGLVAAAELAEAGWSVTLLERHDDIGGFIASGERTLPGYIHDTYSSWHPLFVTGPAHARLGERLREHGLTYRNTEEWVTASVADDGRVTLAHRDPKVTAAGFAYEADRDAYLAALRLLDEHMGPVGGLLGGEPRSSAGLRHLADLFRIGGRAGVEGWARSLVTGGRGYARSRFRGTEVDHLYAPWLLHAGLSPDHASGGFMIPLLAATLHGAGLPVVAGGAGRFTDAFRSLLDSLGVRIITGTEVERVLVDGNRARGVVADGRVVRARRAVLASVTPTVLYGRLLPRDTVDREVREQAARFRYGRAALQIHAALSGPVPWRDERLGTVPLIHLSDGSGSTGIACAEAEAGLLPRRPTVAVGQQHVLDPGRVPEGAAALWLQLQEVPFAPLGDAAGELDTGGGWTTALARSYADRVLDRVAAHAPGLRERILALDIITPVDLAARNPNAVCGDPYGGSLELDQNYLWRPLPGAGTHRTPIEGLWHIGASTHPGPGLGGGSGHTVATTLLADGDEQWRGPAGILPALGV